MRLKLAEAFDRWQHNQANFHFGDTDDPTGEVYSGLHGAYSCLLGLARQKWWFVHLAPWRLWECRDQVEARRLYDLHVERKHAGKWVHRVSDYYMDDSTILGNDFANWATNVVMTELLDYELAFL